MNSWLMKRYYRKGTDALSPENPIVLGAGPSIGTGVPGAAKIVATTSFPLNGTICDSVRSMAFARCLKGAGFDHVVISGRAKRLSILVSKDVCATLECAAGFAGSDIWHTTDAIKREEHYKNSSVLEIGPAGENMVAFCLAVVDKASTPGRGVLAAVMGSKNLKAILATGEKKAHYYI